MRVMPLLAGAPQGGAETFFVSLVAALNRAGIDQRPVIRTNPARAEALRAAGVEPLELPFRQWLDFRTGAGLRGAVASYKPDVALAFMNRAAAWMPSGDHLKCARLGGYYDLKYYRRCDHLLCITHDIRRHVVEHGWPGQRAHYMPNFAEADEHPAQDRAALATPEDAPLLMVPSRLHKVKGLDTMLKALARVPSAYLWLAGEGPERAALEQLAQDLGVAERVRFLGWRSDKGALFRACDIVVFPSRYEPFGTVSLEAWAYGKPLVAADSDGPAGLVRPEEDALLVPRDDVEALAAALTRVIEEPGLARRLVDAGAARHRGEFTEAACAKRYIDLFERLLAERQREKAR